MFLRLDLLVCLLMLTSKQVKSKRLSPELVKDCNKRIAECYGNGVEVNNKLLSSEQRNCFTGFRCHGNHDFKRQKKMAQLDVDRIEKLLAKKSLQMQSRNSATLTCETAQVLVIACTTLGMLLVKKNVPQ